MTRCSQSCSYCRYAAIVPVLVTLARSCGVSKWGKMMMANKGNHRYSQQAITKSDQSYHMTVTLRNFYITIMYREKFGD